MGDGGVSYSKPEIAARPFEWKFWLGCFAVIAVFITWQVLRPKKAVLQNVPAPPFVLPEGCNPADVRDQSDFKPKSPCFDEKYRIKDYEKFNFFEPGGRNPSYYYRFFDKAVVLRCSRTQECQINHIHSGVFSDLDKVNK
jgi:hypothetical protein